jgi:hypothetical protein
MLLKRINGITEKAKKRNEEAVEKMKKLNEKKNYE